MVLLARLLAGFVPADRPVFWIMRSLGADALDFSGIEDALDFMYGMIWPNTWWDWLCKGMR